MKNNMIDDLFSFARFLGNEYTYFDLTEEGDIYISNSTKEKLTQEQVYEKWLITQR